MHKHAHTVRREVHKLSVVAHVVQGPSGLPGLCTEAPRTIMVRRAAGFSIPPFYLLSQQTLCRTCCESNGVLCAGNTSREQMEARVPVLVAGLTVNIHLADD